MKRRNSERQEPVLVNVRVGRTIYAVELDSTPEPLALTLIAALVGVSRQHYRHMKPAGIAKLVSRLCRSGKWGNSCITENHSKSLH